MTDSALPPWSIEALTTGHLRDAFDCGKQSLNDYLKQYALQNQKKNVGRTFVAVRPGQVDIKGYYTLSSSSVAFATLPKEGQKGLPRYPIPFVHMGRLAVSQDARGCGLGTILLINALRRTQKIGSELGVCGMEVYALDDDAKKFYLKYGFIELADDHLHLYLPMKIIQELLFSNP